MAPDERLNKLGGRVVARRVGVTADCQTAGLVAALAAMLPDDIVVPCAPAARDERARVKQVRDVDVWVTSDTALNLDGSRPLETLLVPMLKFSGFHPDIGYAHVRNGRLLQSPAGDYNSLIVLWGWKHGLTPAQIRVLFEPEVLNALGYTTAWWGPAVERMRARYEDGDIDFGALFLRLQRSEPFMLSVNHPRMFALVEVARQVAKRLGANAERVVFPWEGALPDFLLSNAAVWPVYPPVARELSLRGGYFWRASNGATLDLDGFIAASVATYRHSRPDDVWVRALEEPRFDNVLSLASGAPA